MAFSQEAALAEFQGFKQHVMYAIRKAGGNIGNDVCRYLDDAATYTELQTGLFTVVSQLSNFEGSPVAQMLTPIIHGFAGEAGDQRRRLEAEVLKTR